jgi:hypothetical protein
MHRSFEIWSMTAYRTNVRGSASTLLGPAIMNRAQNASLYEAGISGASTVTVFDRIVMIVDIAGSFRTASRRAADVTVV